MGTRRAFGTLELLLILAFLALLIWLLFSARAGNAGSFTPPGVEDAIRDLILTTQNIATEVPR
jgi:hypothetical protein